MTDPSFDLLMWPYCAYLADIPHFPLTSLKYVWILQKAAYI